MMSLWQMCVSLVVLCCSWSLSGQHQTKNRLQVDPKALTDSHGAIIRGDVSEKKIALVFTGDEFADGGIQIANTLKKNNVKASFFFTGNFYNNEGFKTIIQDLQRDGHYLGAHSDKHLLYADWSKRDSLLVSEKTFKQDLENNYRRMKKFGIDRSDALLFLPPYEWYNSTISLWTKEAGLQLINFSPGTFSAADYTYPEMGDRYRSSDEIYRSIMTYEKKDTHGLNGFILLLHVGTDPRRTDKLYYFLEDIIKALQRRGYSFCRIDVLLLL